MYTTPFTTTGAAANAPVFCTPAAAVPVSLKLQASRSEATFADEMADPAASRVLARSPFGYGQEPDGVAAPWKLVVVGGGGLLLQAAAPATVTAASRPMPALEILRLICRSPSRDRGPRDLSSLDIFLSKTDITMIDTSRRPSQRFATDR